ncbi:MAG: hypothetical protein HC822_13200 [Oscillochloris sp.]|nr:hypothetical protein [Oscillochloris sp.]
MKQRICAGLLALTLTACNFAGNPTPTSPAVPPTSGADLLPTAAPDATPIPIAAPTADATDAPADTAPTAATLDPATSAESQAEFEAIAGAERSPRDQITLAKSLGTCREAPDACPDVARTTPLDVQVGEVRDFYVTDFDTNTQFVIQAELRYAGPVALMYVEQGLQYDQDDLERAAQVFEQEIYPRTREIFGSELQPGVDGDPRITILNARDPSGQVLGYYSSQDSLTSQVNRYSNEREMFFMNIALMPFDDLTYLDVLAHEFQHMIHQNEQPNSATWFNEGASQLSEDLNGYFNNGFTLSYLFDPDVQLTGWAVGPGQAGPHYGAAHLFLRYIYAQYAGEAQLRPLVQADAGDNLDAFVALARQTRPEISDFGQIMADWAVANLIDDPEVGDGRYSYATGHELPSLLPINAQAVVVDREVRGSVAQFGVDYLELPAGTATIEFQGDTTIGLTAEPPRDTYAWWSNRSDDSIASLTRPLDLRNLDRATLEFDTWYEIENNYDYAFVTVSTDGGATWETLPGSLTTSEDPQGVNYGYGITGVSGAPGAKVEDGVRGRWVTERMDLTPYAGNEILLRFWHITDQGFNAPGMLIDNIRVPELNFSDDVESGAGEWQAEGFVRVDGDLAQQWQLRLVRIAADGTISVEALAVADDGRAEANLADGERGVLVVTATTPYTSERANYTLVGR